ncbi:MAG: peroxiredoxin [Myxococcales bacterium]|nr:peroxiredoxin [Myxococcales bacterium]
MDVAVGKGRTRGLGIASATRSSGGSRDGISKGRRHQQFAVIGFNNQDVDSHRRWADELGGVRFPMGADESGEVSRAYGVLLDDGLVIRGTWIIDPEGRVKWAQQNWRPIGRDVDGILRELRALQSGGACMVNWKPSA